MKGPDQVVTLLNEVLTAELTAINQYFIHARMCENWGYQRLWKKVREESIGEMKHADLIIERILFLEGVPNLQRLAKVHVGEPVSAQRQLDLGVEKGAAGARSGGGEGSHGYAQRRRRAGAQRRRQRHARVARAHPHRRGEARQLDRGAALAHPAGRRGELPRAADNRGLRVYPRPPS